MADYLSTDPNAGAAGQKYLSTDPHAGASAAPASAPKAATPGEDLPPLQKTIAGAGETLLNMGSGMIAKPVSDIAGLAAMPLHALGAIETSPSDVKAAVQEGGTYEPKTKYGKAMSEYNPLALIGKLFGWTGGKAREAIEPKGSEGGGAAEIKRGMARGVEEGIQQLPGFIGARRVSTLPKTGVVLPKPAPRAPYGEGAEKTVNELQRQQDVLASGKAGPTPGPSSPVETAMGRAQGATGQFQEILKNTHGNFDASHALTQIDRQLGSTAIEAGERAALNKVKSAIELAVKNNQGSSAAPSRMTAAQYRAMQSGPKASLPIDYIDQVRQIINGEISAKDASGKPLGKDAQRRLYDVQNALLKDVPPEYRKAITDIHETKSGVEALEGGARKDVTTDANSFGSLSAVDKQNMLENAFKDTTPGRALSELVRDTAHNPEAAAGLRAGYTDWLTKADPVSGQPKVGALLKKWTDTREAVKQSGLMTPDHLANFDKIMSDVSEGSKGGAVKKSVASVAGYIAGLSYGHPIATASAARGVASETMSRASSKALENAVIKLSADPAAAAALAAPPTAANVTRIRKMLPVELAAVIESQQRPEKKSRNPLSMTPVIP